MDFLYEPDAEEPSPPSKGRSLLGKLAVVGVTGAVISGAVVGFSGLASAQAADEADTPAEAVEVTEDADDGYVIESDFDRFSEQDQALILEFEQCLDDAGLDGESEEVPENIDEIFEACEAVLDDLSFEADEWLEGEDLELSPEDEAILDEFEACLSEGGFDEFEAEIEGDFNGDVEDGDYENYEEEVELSDEELAEIEALFEGCEELLDGLSDGSIFLLEGCPDEHYEDEHYEDDHAQEDIEEDTDA